MLVKKYIFLFLVLTFSTSMINSQPLKYPVTKKTDQTDTYFGVTVADPYRWLENDRAPEVESWVAEQNKLTFDYLGKIPFRNQIKERIEKIYNYPRYSAPSKHGDIYLFSKNDGLQNQAVLYIQKGMNGTPEVLIDPNKLSEDGTVRLTSSALSKDQKYLAYSISRSGSDWQEFYVLDVATKTKLKDSLAWVKFSDASWKGDGFYYSRYDAPKVKDKSLSEKNEFHKVYFHKLGDNQSKDQLIYQDKNPLLFFSAGLTEDDRFLFLYGAGGGNGNSLYYKDLTKDQADFLPIVTTMDDQISPLDNIGDKLIVHTVKNAPNGKVVLIDTKKPEESNWVTLIPERDYPISEASTAGGKIIITYMKDVTNRTEVFDYNGKFENEISLPGLGTVSGFGGYKIDTDVFYAYTSYLCPTTIYAYNINSKKSSLFRKPEIDFKTEDYTTKQVFYKSKDGEKIPMFILMKKDIALDGTNPTLLYGYGGFNISLTPGFNPVTLAWLEQGGIYVVANLRGGNEYGEKWHQAGIKLNKQNVFDDCIAAAEYLINEKYTSRKRLAINGGSNGGLLVGAVVNQRPDLFRVAVPEVGVMDMLRYEKFTIGWNWASDYGSAADSIQFTNLYKYSPLHNIKAGVEYPAILATTADHDDRVVPAHSFKYMAALQDKYKGLSPTLIRIETKSGHGSSSTSKRIEVNADIFSFIFYNMDIVPKY